MSLTNDIMEKLILDGAAEMAGIDLETGDMLYSFTPLLEEKHPEIYAEVTKYFQSQVMMLWEKGFLSMDIMDEEPTVTLTGLAYDEEAKATLQPSELRTLETVIDQFNKNL